MIDKNEVFQITTILLAQYNKPIDTDQIKVIVEKALKIALEINDQCDSHIANILNNIPNSQHNIKGLDSNLIIHNSSIHDNDKQIPL